MSRSRSSAPGAGVAGADAEDQPPARALVHRGGRHREQQRRAGAHRQDAGPEQQVARLAREPAERDERVAPRDLGQEEGGVPDVSAARTIPTEIAPRQRVAERERRRAGLSEVVHTAPSSPRDGADPLPHRGRPVARGRAPTARRPRPGRRRSSVTPIRARRQQGSPGPVGDPQRAREPRVSRCSPSTSGGRCAATATHGGGRTEVRDVAAAIDARARGGGRTDPRLRLVLRGQRRAAGGARGRAGRRPRAASASRSTATSTSRGRPAPAELRLLRRPVLLISGANDEYSPVADLERLRDELPDGRLVVVPGTDHFLWRREREAAAASGNSRRAWQADARPRARPGEAAAHRRGEAASCRTARRRGRRRRRSRRATSPRARAGPGRRSPRTPSRGPTPGASAGPRCRCTTALARRVTEEREPDHQRDDRATHGPSDENVTPSALELPRRTPRGRTRSRAGGRPAGRALPPASGPRP